MISLSKKRCILMGLMVLVGIIGFLSLTKINRSEIESKSVAKENANETQNVKIELKSITRLCDGFYANFAVVNNRPDTIYFVGYSINSPRYRLETILANQWIDTDEGNRSCGVGLDEFDIEPNNSTHFVAKIFSNSTKVLANKLYRVGMVVNNKNNTESFDIWSDPFSLYSKPIDNKCNWTN